MEIKVGEMGPFQKNRQIKKSIIFLDVMDINVKMILEKENWNLERRDVYRPMSDLLEGVIWENYF